jgi:hypothetical protein
MDSPIHVECRCLEKNTRLTIYASKSICGKKFTQVSNIICENFCIYGIAF